VLLNRGTLLNMEGRPRETALAILSAFDAGMSTKPLLVTMVWR
jgi:hypothetical protein